MYFLVLQGWDAGAVDEVARVLAELLAKNLPEARPRLLGGGPIVVASFHDLAPAAAMADALRSRGIADLMLIGGGDLETDAMRLFTRDFELGERGLRIADRRHSLEIPYGEIELLLRGTRVETHTDQGQRSTRTFSLARAVLSGGLIMTRKVEAVPGRRTEERTGFFHLYAGRRPVVVFRETDLRFKSLGTALQLSRQANFHYLVAELRRRAPTAIYDERLVPRGGPIQLLGSGLSPDRHLDLALSVLARALRPTPR